MDLLEIRLTVGSFLSLRDLAVCVRVSKIWNASFIQPLYASASKNDLAQHWSSFERQLDHVRDLEIDVSLNPQERSILCEKARRLKKLHLCLFPPNDDTSNSALDSFNRLFENNGPTLHDLHITGFYAESPDPKLLEIVICKSSPRITTLSLAAMTIREPFLDQVFFTGGLASRLTTFFLCVVDFPKKSTLPELSRFRFPELRELTVGSGRRYRSDDSEEKGTLTCEDQMRMFEHCPKLESLCWLVHLWYSDKSYKNNMGLLYTLSSILHPVNDDNNNQDSSPSTSRWPKLHSLELSEGKNRGRPSTVAALKDPMVALILKSCPNPLRKLIFPGADVASQAWPALQRHLPTLNILKLDTPSWMIQEILSTCSELREFQGACLAGYAVVDGFGAEEIRELESEKEAIRWAGTDETASCSSSLIFGYPLPSSVPRPWACLQLRSLKCRYWSLDDFNKADHQFFQRIAQLKYLEELYLTPFKKDTTTGFDPRFSLGIEIDDGPESLVRFDGIFKTAEEIRQTRVGRRLLEIWPSLQECHLYEIKQ